MSERWLLLLHQIPAKPDYLRVKVWRRMQRLGAVPLKNAAWVLPAGEDAMEDFHWLRREIEADGGEALLCEARILAGLTRDQVEALRRVRASRAGGERGSATELTERPASEDAVSVASSPGRTWVTRRDVHVDRIASAWLIRRFVDPGARFRFVEPQGYTPTSGEVRFDMYEAEYTHVGDGCTFEVLASTFAPGDAALGAIAQVVHDIDLKDVRFGRPEGPGVELLIEGIVASEPDDPSRLERGFALLEALYAALDARMERSGR